MVKDAHAFVVFVASYCKKVASVIPTYAMQKSLVGAVNAEMTNYAVFATEKEAVEWLLSDA